MIEKDKLKPGDHVYWSRWEIAKSGRRLNINPHPEEVVVKKTETSSWGIRVGKLGDSDYYFMARPGDLFWTLEEAWEEYNKDIYNTIDMITEKYEKSVRYLKSKLHEDD